MAVTYFPGEWKPSSKTFIPAESAFLLRPGQCSIPAGTRSSAAMLNTTATRERFTIISIFSLSTCLMRVTVTSTCPEWRCLIVPAFRSSIDRFRYAQVYQSFQLFQRGVRLDHPEGNSGPPVLFQSSVLDYRKWDGSITRQPCSRSRWKPNWRQKLGDPRVLYLDFFTGDIDHEGHATNDPAALLDSMKRLDALAGRIWTCIQEEPARARKR